MCARPRTVSDAELLQAAARAVSRVGPARLTLADVAAEGGVVPATLVQRFGSKRELLLALARKGSEGAAEQVAALRAGHSSPLDALRAVADCLTGMASSAEELANHLTFLILDLTDPEFHHYAVVQSRAFHSDLRTLLNDAVAAGELLPCDTERLARVVQEMLHGALVVWAIHRDGSAKDWVRRDLQTLLEPYIAANNRGPKRRARAGSRPSRPKGPNDQHL
jgi:AcrR family transcriptional regulator